MLLPFTRSIHEVEVGFDRGPCRRISGRVPRRLWSVDPVGVASPTTLQSICLVPTGFQTSPRRRTVATNKVPNAPYRGAGRPGRSPWMNYGLIAQTLGLEPTEVRRRNMIHPKKCPVPWASLIVTVNRLCDSGDFLAPWTRYCRRSVACCIPGPPARARRWAVISVLALQAMSRAPASGHSRVQWCGLSRPGR